MTVFRRAISTIAVSMLLMFFGALSYAATVTVDAAAKTATSDTTALEARPPRIVEKQIGVFVKSTVLTPQNLTIKFNGLTEEKYDVYVNKAYLTAKTAQELGQGLDLKIEGRVVDDGMIACLAAVKDAAKSEQAAMNASNDPEAKRIYMTLSQAEDWCQAALQRDQAWRSVGVAIVPSGKAMRNMDWMTRDSDYDTARAVTRACWLLQQARDRMYHGIKNADLRNRAVVAMTPIQFSATYSKKNGKPHIDAQLTNQCDLPIKGSIGLALPSGWKTTAKTLQFASLKCGQTFKLSFDLIAPSKKAEAPASIPMAANAIVVQDTFTAALKLIVTAQGNPQ